MPIRINRVYTRAGDDGETGLVGGQRVRKDCPRIEAFGTVDELNSAVGVALADCTDVSLQTVRADLLWVQQKLFDLGAYLATPPEVIKAGMPIPTTDDVKRLETTMDAWGKDLEALTSFVLPGGGRLGALLHAARTVCRRAERETLRLHGDTPVDATALAFLNRLSDFFFVAARHVGRLLGEPETLWTPGQTPKTGAEG